MNIHPDTTPIKPPRRWWVRWLRRLGFALLLSLIGFACRQAIVHYDRVKKLQAATAELDQSDPGWRLKDIEAARAPIADGDNGILCVKAAVNNLPRRWPAPDFVDHFEHLNPEEQLHPESFRLLEKELAPLQSALKQALLLADRPCGRPRIVYLRNIVQTDLTDQNHVRTVFNLLTYEALRQCQERDLHGALVSCQATLNAGRAIGDEPQLITQLIRMAGVHVACGTLERILAQGEPSPQELIDLQRALANEDSHPGLLIALRGERALMHEMFDAVESGDVTMSQILSENRSDPTWSDYLLGWSFRDNCRKDHVFYLHWVTRQIAAAQKPSHEQVRAEQLLNHEMSEQWHEYPLARLFLRLAEKVSGTSRRTHARLRCAIVALALEQYRHKHGSWPDSLKALTPDLLKTIPADPFDGQPLRYHRLNDGVIVYSVGSDLEDNLGRTDRIRPDQPGSDLVFRLWDVPRRRQPPRPKPPEKPGPPGMPGPFAPRPR